MLNPRGWEQISMYARAYLVRKCNDIDPRIAVPLRHLHP